MIGVYVACPLGESATARKIAALVSAPDVVIVSRWHDDPRVVAGEPDPVDEDERRAIADANETDLARADLVIVMTHRGNPRSTFCEAGSAIGRGKPVVWVVGQDRIGRCSHDSHPLVFRVEAAPDWDVPWMRAVLCIVRGEAARRVAR